MSTPSLSSASSRIWIAERDPTVDELNTEVGNFWYNKSTKEIFLCDSDLSQNQIWSKKPSSTGTRSFTPVVQGSISAGTANYSVQTGFYEKIGGLLFVVINLAWSNHTGSGNLQISGLPFNLKPDAIQTSSISLRGLNLPLNTLTPFSVTNQNVLEVKTLVLGATESFVSLQNSGVIQLTSSFFSGG